ncbi:MAG: site-specific integrase, partial [Planctomycetes bacterium]|nr:site-specific integrase [Planctomycetota bacterium]
MEPTRIPRDPPSPQALLAEFLVFLGAELQLSPNTVAAYRRDLTRLLRDADTLPDRPALVAHLRGLRNDHADTSVVRALAAIRGFFRYLHAERYLATDPADGLLGPKLEQHLPPVLDSDSVERLLACFPGDDPLSRRNTTMLHVLYASGCRVSELLELRPESIVPDLRCLRLSGKGNKQRV